MIKRIAIIPARSGSKGIKNKNIKELNGKPLMAYTIKCAIESKMFNKVFVSTDSKKYACIAKQNGADASFLRSKKNSSDKASTWDVVEEVIKKLNSKGEYFDEIMVLQVTSPLRTKEDIIKAVEILHKKRGNAVVSLTKCEHSPIWCNVLPKNNRMDHFDKKEYKDLPRQLLPTFYRYNGAIYLIKASELNNRKHMFEKKCFAYIMPQTRSVDIDTNLDFIVAETLMKVDI